MYKRVGVFILLKNKILILPKGKFMLKTATLVLLLLGLQTSTVCAGDWPPLLDKQLSKWDIYLLYKHKLSYDGSVPKDEKGNVIEPIWV
jgi:hypothetical protein